MTRQDDELFDAIRQALAPAELSPSGEEMARFWRALDAAPSIARRRSRDPKTQWRARSVPRGLVAAGVFLLAGLGAFSGGVASNSLPAPLRTAAYDLGLPVSSPALVAAQAAESALSSALRAHDRSAVVTDIQVLEQRLAALQASDRAQIGPGAMALLTQAAEFLAESAASPRSPGEGPGDDQGAGDSPSQPPGTTEPTDTGGSESGVPESSQTTTPDPSQGGENSGSPSGESSRTQSTDSTTSTTSPPASGDAGDSGGGASSNGGATVSSSDH